MKKILVAFALILASLSLFAPSTLAESGYSNFDVSEILDIDPTSDDAETGGQSTDIFESIRDEAEENNTSFVGAILLRAINVLSLLVGTFAFITIMIGGFMLVTAGGDTGKIDRAKGIFAPAIVGTVISFLAYFITAFVQSFFY